MSYAMGIVATGVIVHVRGTGAEYGMHDDCAAAFMGIAGDGAFVMGPLFTDDWECAYGACEHL